MNSQPKSESVRDKVSFWKSWWLLFYALRRKVVGKEQAGVQVEGDAGERRRFSKESEFTVGWHASSWKF